MSILTSINFRTRMKRFLALFAFLLASFSFVAAQGNGGGNNGNGYGNNNGNNNPWASINGPQWLMSWLQNGGQIPVPLALVIIHRERDWGMSNFGLTQGQMIQKYATGQLTIEFISTSPPSLTFRVRFGGVGDIIIIDDF